MAELTGAEALAAEINYDRLPDHMRGGVQR